MNITPNSVLHGLVSVRYIIAQYQNVIVTSKDYIESLFRLILKAE